jgi:hypothetical protein
MSPRDAARNNYEFGYQAKSENRYSTLLDAARRFDVLAAEIFSSRLSRNSAAAAA